jgi:hypothetical protein
MGCCSSKTSATRAFERALYEKIKQIDEIIISEAKKGRLELLCNQNVNYWNDNLFVPEKFVPFVIKHFKEKGYMIIIHKHISPTNQQYNVILPFTIKWDGGDGDIK